MYNKFLAKIRLLIALIINLLVISRSIGPNVRLSFNVVTMFSTSSILTKKSVRYSCKIPLVRKNVHPTGASRRCVSWVYCVHHAHAAYVVITNGICKKNTLIFRICLDFRDACNLPRCTFATIRTSVVTLFASVGSYCSAHSTNFNHKKKISSFFPDLTSVSCTLTSGAFGSSQNIHGSIIGKVRYVVHATKNMV